MKRYVLILLLFTFIIPAYVSTAADSQKTDDNNTMKFRGSVAMVFAYYFWTDPTLRTRLRTPNSGYFYDYTDEGDPANNHHTPGDPGLVVKPRLFHVDFQVSANLAMIAPFLRFDHFLLKDNNVKFDLGITVSPISLGILGEISFTPVAFFVLGSGAKIGSGWNLEGLGAKGMARIDFENFVPEKSDTIILDDSLLGPLFQNWYFATLQFDIAALMPENLKRWTHIVFVAKQKFKYMSLLTYDYYERPYYWEDLIHFNGWTFHSDFVIGYQIPVIIDERKKAAEEKMFIGAGRHKNFTITAVMWANLEGNLTHYNDSMMKDKGWGSDFVYCTFGPNIFFELPHNFFAMLAFHWRNEMSYTSETVGNAYFKNYEYEDWYVEFRRIAIEFGWAF